MVNLNTGVRFGNLTRDPDLRSLQSGKKVVKFGIAVNRSYKKDGEWQNEAAFLECEAWDSGAEAIAARFRKGDPIIIEESIRQDNWEDKDGNKRTRLVFRVNRFHTLPGYDYENHAWKSKAKELATSRDDDYGDDTIPF